jgi:hypothetical protein
MSETRADAPQRRLNAAIEGVCSARTAQRDKGRLLKLGRGVRPLLEPATEDTDGNEKGEYAQRVDDRVFHHGRCGRGTCPLPEEAAMTLVFRW